MKKFIKFIVTAVVFALITVLAIGCSPATGESKDKEISFREFAEHKHQLFKNVKPIDYDSIYDFELHYKMTANNHTSDLEQVPSEDGESENIIVVDYHVSALYESNLSVKRVDGDVFITISTTQKHKHVDPFYLDPTLSCENSDEIVNFYQTGKDEIGYYVIKENVIKYDGTTGYNYSGYNEYRRFDSREEYQIYVMSILDYDNFYTFDDIYLAGISGTFTKSKEGVTMNMQEYEGGLSDSSSYEDIGEYNATYTKNGVYTKSKNSSKIEEFRDKTKTEDLTEIEINKEYSSSYSPKSIDFVRYEQAYVDIDLSDIIYMDHDI